MYKVVKYSDNITNIVYAENNITVATIDLDFENITVDISTTIINYFELRALIDEVLAGDYE